MAQCDVLEALEKQKKAMSRTEIAAFLKKDVTMVSHAITRLLRGCEIKIIEIDRKQAMKRYHCKRRMRLYYV